MAKYQTVQSTRQYKVPDSTKYKTVQSTRQYKVPDRTKYHKVPDKSREISNYIFCCLEFKNKL